MKSFQYIVWCVAVLLTACTHVPEMKVPVYECAAPSEGRASAICFAADSMIHVVGGRIQNGSFCSTMLLYDARYDQWKETGTLPFPPRVNGVACVTPNGVYLGLGWSGGNSDVPSTYAHDWWRYDPINDTWAQMANCPSVQTAGAVSWYYDQCVWIASAFQGYTNDIWRYDIASDSWSQANDKNPLRVMAPVAAQSKGRYFIGTGFYKQSRSDWWEWLGEGKWEQRASVPGNGRHNAACSGTKSSVWIFGGWHYGDSLTHGFHYEDILRYSPDEDKWTLCGTLPCGTMENGVACTIGNRVYFGLGEDKKGMIHTKWYYIEE